MSQKIQWRLVICSTATLIGLILGVFGRSNELARDREGSGFEHVTGEVKTTARSSTLLERDVKSLISTCFSGLLKLDDNTLKPVFVLGDFNGDGRRDLFAPVRLARNVDAKNRSKPPFTYQQVLDPTSPASAALDLRLGDLAEVETWPLFSVVHDIDGAMSNRCSQAGGKYLLLFAMDNGTSRIRVFSRAKLPRGTIGDETEDEPPPRLRGAAILLLDNEGSGSALYWDGSRYRWYPYN